MATDDIWHEFQTKVGAVTHSGFFTKKTKKPVIHFLHGTGFCGRAYEPFLNPLRTEFDVFMQDVQGHGNSSVGGPFVGWQGSARQALAVMDTQREYFGERPVIGVGHSFGGVVTMFMGAMDPARFAGLVLLEPVFFSKSKLMIMKLADWLGVIKRNPLAKQALRRRSRWSNREAAWNYLHQRGIFKGWDDVSLNAYLDHGLKTHPDGCLELKCPPEMEAALFSSYPAKLWHHLKILNIPTLALIGDRGYPLLHQTVPQASQINKLITGKQLKGGHCFMQEDSAVVGQRVRQLCLELLRH